MSNSLAKKRRVNLPPPPSPVPSPSNLNQPPSGGERRPMTLPQVLSILEMRLSAIEKNQSTRKVEDTTTTEPTSAVDDSLKETLDEYESRFEMLADQINYLKDTLMKLQTFTMEVNKTLFEERVQISMPDVQDSSIHFSKADDEE